MYSDILLRKTIIILTIYFLMPYIEKIGKGIINILSIFLFKLINFIIFYYIVLVCFIWLQIIFNYVNITTLNIDNNSYIINIIDVDILNYFK